MRFSLFDGALRVSPDVEIATSDTSLGLTDALRARPDTGDLPDLFESRPGLRLRVGAAAVSGVTVGDARTTASAFASAPPTNPLVPLTGSMFRRDLTAGATAALEARYTLPPTRSGVSASIDVRLDSSAAANALDTHAMLTQLEPIFRDAMSVAAEASAMQQQVESLVADLNGPLMQNFRNALAAHDQVRMLEYGAQLFDRLKTAMRLLDQAGAISQRLDGMLTSVEATTSASGGASARGTVDVDATFRSPRARFRSGEVDVSLIGAITLGTSVPLPNPAAGDMSETGMRPIRSLAAVVDAVVNVSTEGVAALREQLAEIAPDLQALRQLGREVNFGLSAEEARALEGQARTLEESLQGHAERLLLATGLTHAEIAARVRVSEAVGPGIGVRAVGVTGRVSYRNAFSADLSLTMRNPIGVMPGEVSDYAIGEDAQAHLLSTRLDDIYDSLFPRAFSADLRLLARPTRDMAVELRGVVDFSASHFLLSSSLSVSMWGFFLGASTSTAYMDGRTLSTEVGAVAGYRTPEGYGFSLSAGVNPEAFSSTDALSAASARLSVTLPPF